MINKPNTTEDVLLDFEEFGQNELSLRHAEGHSVAVDQTNVPPWNYAGKQLFPPFTYFGGKRDIAEEVWRRFGPDIPNYIEPFAGGLSVLLGRPIFDMRMLDGKKCRELANDANSFLLNFWRAIQNVDIREIIKSVDFPAHETELLGRREYMMEKHGELSRKIQNDKKKLDVCDPELAGYWLYIQREWIGAGADDPESFPFRKMIRAKEGGYLGESLEEHLHFLQLRTKHVRFFNDGWERPLISDTQSTNIGITGVFLDPPYMGSTDIYGGRLDNETLVDRDPLNAREWALEKGKSPEFRIAYCGYLHQHDGFFPEGGDHGWVKKMWKFEGGYSKRLRNKEPRIETVWFSPGCIKPDGDPGSGWIKS
ncbi:MAG: DNA adenine methylase [Pyrinomonadaceae bacterium]